MSSQTPSSGHLYIVIRSDFIKKKQLIFKIGQTKRFPPHSRLWDYPHGSLFLGLFETRAPIQFEKEVKKHLMQSKQLIWRKSIGLEYFEGCLQTIIDIVIAFYPQYQTTETHL